MAELEIKIRTKRTIWYYVLILFYRPDNVPKFLKNKIWMRAYVGKREWFTAKIGDYLKPDTDVAG